MNCFHFYLQKLLKDGKSLEPGKPKSEIKGSKVDVAQTKPHLGQNMVAKLETTPNKQDAKTPEPGPPKVEIKESKVDAAQTKPDLGQNIAAKLETMPNKQDAKIEIKKGSKGDLTTAKDPKTSTTAATPLKLEVIGQGVK